MLPDNKIVRGVWIGGRLTPIQQLCIRSFQDNGHEFHLYVPIDRAENIPDGTIVHSIHEVTAMGDRQKFTCDSHFSDWFRVNLIYQLGGWYVDMDEVCLQPFDFPDPYVFVSEYPDGLVNGCIFKAPADCTFLHDIICSIKEMDTLHPASWIAVGPQLFRDAVKQYGLARYVQPPYVFDGLSPSELHDFTSTGVFGNPKTPHAAHLRTSYWTAQNGLDPNRTYPKESDFEALKAKHGVANV